MLVPLESALERNCAGEAEERGGTSEPRVKSLSRQARGWWVRYLDLCRVSKRPAGRKISGPFLLEHGSADYFPRESRWVLSGDSKYYKAMKSRRHEQARFGPVADSPAGFAPPPGVGSPAPRGGAPVHHATRREID
jgi:hypothetical protein